VKEVARSNRPEVRVTFSITRSCSSFPEFQLLALIAGQSGKDCTILLICTGEKETIISVLRQVSDCC
jgi:hypothetical protein